MPTYYKKPNFNSCVLCLKSTKKGYDISLHKFPKNPARRAVWLKNCGFVEEDVQHNRKLCSSHFEKNCIILTGIRRVLKKSAIPVIFKETITMKKNKKQSQYSQTVSETDTTLKTQVDYPENPAADVIPMAVLCQFTAKLSEYSLDPEKSYGTNNVPIIPVNY